MFSTIFASFKDHFPPANPDDATLKLTSSELHQTFARFMPEGFEEKTLFDAMIDAGYHYKPENRSGTINFYWYLCEKK